MVSTLHSTQPQTFSPPCSSPSPSPQHTQTEKDNTHNLKNDPDHQTPARANGNVLTVLAVGARDLELVAAWAGGRLRLQRWVVGHVFDFDFVVDGVFFVGHFGYFD